MCFHGERSSGGCGKEAVVDVGELTKHLLDRAQVAAVDRHQIHRRVHRHRLHSNIGNILLQRQAASLLPPTE